MHQVWAFPGSWGHCTATLAAERVIMWEQLDLLVEDLVKNKENDKKALSMATALRATEPHRLVPEQLRGGWCGADLGMSWQEGLGRVCESREPRGTI